MLNKSGAVPAAVFVERRAAVDPVLIPVTAENQAVLLVELQIILPVQRISVSVEHRVFVAELVEGFLAVLAVADFHPGLPGIVQARVDVAADTAHGEIAVGLLLDTFVVGYIATKRIVELTLAAVIQNIQASFEVVIEAVAQAQTQGLIAIGVMITIAGVRLAGAVDPCGLVEAGPEVEAGVLVAAR